MSLGWKLTRPQFFDQFIQSTTDSKSGIGGKKAETLGFICDDVFFLWRSSTQTIVRAPCSDIWRDDHEIPAAHQVWALSSSLPFQATYMSVRKSSSVERCLLWGPSGIAVVTIQVNKGPSAPGKVLPAQVDVLGERAYVDHSRLAIIQAKWHPHSTMNIVMVLNNDYFIRCYDLSEPSVSFAVVCAGPPTSVPFNYTQLSVGLSEPPVDFDIGPEVKETGQWTIFILKSSGSLSYILMKIIDATKRCHWEPEKVVSMQGIIDDIFDLPATLLVTRSFPVVVAIGSLSGKLYHSVILPSDTDAYDSENMEKAVISGDTTLFVKEVLELESDYQLSFVRLIPDPLCSNRYACVHEGGIHVITMNFVPYMMSLLRGKEEPDDVTTSSTCRYVLCCADDRNKKSILSSSTFSNSIPQKFVTITGNGETLVYDIPRFPTLNASSHEIEKLANDSRTSFLHVVPELKALEMVTSLLEKTVNQPYLACNDDLSPEKRENILMDSVRTLEQEYIQKQEQTMDFLGATISHLLEKVDDLADPLNKLLNLQPVLRDNAEDISIRYEEQNDVQDALARRLDTVMLEQQKTLPVVTDAEKAWLKKLDKLQEEVDHFKEQIEGLKLKIAGNEGQQIIAPKSPPAGRRRLTLSSGELLKIKKEILEHQKDLAELSASFQQIETSMSLSM